MSKKSKFFISVLLSVLQDCYSYEDVIDFLESVLVRAVNSNEFFRFYRDNKVVLLDVKNGKEEDKNGKEAD